MMVEPKLRFKADDGSDFPDWEEKVVEDVCSVTTGNSNTQDRVDGGQYPFYIRSATPVRSNRYLFDTEAVITIGDGQVGQVFHYVKGKFDLHQRCYAMFDFKENIIGKYFYYFFSSHFYKRVMRMSAKATVDSVRREMITKMSLQLPSLPEQRKIADLLSAVDDVIAAQEAEVAAWEKRKKGVMQKLFSQEVRFKADDGSDFPDWEEKTLGDICMYERQRSEGANFVGTENMLKDFGGVTFDNSNADGPGTLYHPGDTLMSNIRPYLKKAWLADRKGTCSTDVLVFHPTSVEPGYLYWLIASDAFVRYVMSAAKGSKMPRGDKKHIMEMPLLLPNKDEQRKIDDCLSSLNDVIIKAKNELAKWQELKKGLLQQMFV